MPKKKYYSPVSKVLEKLVENNFDEKSISLLIKKKNAELEKLQIKEQGVVKKLNCETYQTNKKENFIELSELRTKMNLLKTEIERFEKRLKKRI
ncbi:MAG: hypothetical protein PHR68_03895 [Candidatus Gracilibacteria bacterium]|nr:hypothetical protein [Candidatus Gracilibacteria bacterium]